ncbi:MAG: glycine cleavage system protein GcvH [Steroidobacteraceae bacterium]
MEIRYTAEHEWVAIDGNRATVGITDYAQRALGDLVFVQLPTVGSAISRGAVAAVVESVKAASDIYSPLTGRIIEVNAATVSDPSLVNSDPMGAGWLFKIECNDTSELTQLLDESAYRQIAQ